MKTYYEVNDYIKVTLYEDGEIYLKDDSSDSDECVVIMPDELEDLIKVFQKQLTLIKKAHFNKEIMVEQNDENNNINIMINCKNSTQNKNVEE